MFGDWFSSSFVNVFVVCVLLLAFDFWTVKNVTGRLMVGLRWNSVVEEDGSTTWKFEANEEGLSSTTLDIAVFWIGLFAPGVVWLLLGVRALVIALATTAGRTPRSHLLILVPPTRARVSAAGGLAVALQL